MGGEEDDSTVPIQIQMTILNATGAVVFSLASGVGWSAASGAVLLAPGQYTVVFTGPATGITQPLTFTVRLASLADPVGPQLVDPTDVPLYQSPTNPSQFLYPVGVLTSSLFLWYPAIY
jgi:hypothetical protein